MRAVKTAESCSAAAFCAAFSSLEVFAEGCEGLAAGKLEILLRDVEAMLQTIDLKDFGLGLRCGCALRVAVELSQVDDFGLVGLVFGGDGGEFYL